jgi:hypothetical protein
VNRTRGTFHALRGPFFKQTHGFAHLRITASQAQVRFMDAQGAVLHEFTRAVSARAAQR